MKPMSSAQVHIMNHLMNAQKFPFLKLAWRNVWRNKRRRMLTVGALSFFSFYMLWMIWFSFGTHDVMLENFVRVRLGTSRFTPAALVRI